jgi:hypothetical protein
MQLLFLLPKGEGQDEGEGGAHFKWCGSKIWMTTFPTPALSLGKREKRSQRPGELEAGGRVNDIFGGTPKITRGTRVLHIASKSYQPSWQFYFFEGKNEVVRPAGVEPTTIRLEGGCSIHLSYGRNRQEITVHYAKRQACQFRG